MSNCHLAKQYELLDNWQTKKEKRSYYKTIWETKLLIEITWSQSEHLHCTQPRVLNMWGHGSATKPLIWWAPSQQEIDPENSLMWLPFKRRALKFMIMKKN